MEWFWSALRWGLVHLVLAWVWLQSFRNRSRRRVVRVPGLRVRGVAQGLLQQARVSEWMLSTRNDRARRFRRLAAWAVLSSPALTPSDWDTFLRGIPTQRVPLSLMTDDRAPVWLVVERLVSGDIWDQVAVEIVTRRREVRARIPDNVWRRWLFVGCSPVALRALDELSTVTVDDLAQVLRRRDSATVLSGYLMTSADDLTDEQWDLLLLDWRSSWGVVRDPRLPESVLRRYLQSTYPGVLAGLAAQDRLSEQLRVMAALGAGHPVS